MIMPRSEHAEQCLSPASTRLRILQRIYFKFRTSRLHLNLKCFGTSSLRMHFLDTALLSFRDFFEYILLTVTRSSKLWYAHSKHCFYHLETWHFASFQSKRPICFASNNIIKIFSQQHVVKLGLGLAGNWATGRPSPEQEPPQVAAPGTGVMTWLKLVISRGSLARRRGFQI